MDNELDVLRNKWKSAGSSANEHDSAALIDKLRSQRSKSLNQKIERSYRVPMIVGLLLPALAWTVLDVLELSTLMKVIYGAFGLIMAAGCLIMILKLRECDYTQMNMREAVTTVRKLFHYHIALLILGWMLCLPVLALFLYEISHDTYMMWGAYAGIVIGLCIGIPRQMRIYRNFKKLQHLFDEQYSLRSSRGVRGQLSGRQGR